MWKEEHTTFSTWNKVKIIDIRMWLKICKVKTDTHPSIQNMHKNFLAVKFFFTRIQCKAIWKTGNPITKMVTWYEWMEHLQFYLFSGPCWCQIDLYLNRNNFQRPPDAIYIWWMLKNILTKKLKTIIQEVIYLNIPVNPLSSLSLIYVWDIHFCWVDFI